MKIEVNIEKQSFLIICSLMIVLAGAIVVYAYNSNPSNPAVMGHSVNEVDWSQQIANLKVGNLTVSGSSSFKISDYTTSLASVCMDDKPALIYEKQGDIASVYVSGGGPPGDLERNCRGWTVPAAGLGQESSGKVLFAKWNWNDILISSPSPSGVLITPILLMIYMNKGVNVTAEDPNTPGSKFSAVFTPLTASGTVVWAQGSLYPAAGAQTPSYKVTLKWPENATMRVAPYSYTR